MRKFSSANIFLLVISLTVFAACTQNTPAEVEINTRPAAKILSIEEQDKPFTVVVHNGDTIHAIANKYNVNTREIIELNRLDAPYDLLEGQVLTLPKPRHHIVSKGDTIFSIAKVYNLSVHSLARVNQLEPPYVIKLGQRLRMPSSLNSENFSGEQNFANDISSQNNIAGNDVVASRELPSPEQKNKQALDDPFANTKPNQTAQPLQEQTPKPVSLQDSPWENQAQTLQQQQQQQQPVQKLSAPEKTESSSKKSATSSSSSKSNESERFSWPVRGKILSPFGPKEGGAFNDGITISAPEGTPVLAPADGIIAYSGNELKGYGNLVLIKHKNGYVTSFAHLKDRALKVGDVIKKGDLLGSVGKTGNVSSPRLHFSVRSGRKAINPDEFLQP